MPSVLRKPSVVRKPKSDEETFFRRFLGDPKRTGAVAPSSPFLAREMARAVNPRAPGLVIELGPGTGPVTKALIAHGVARERLLLVEYDAHFCRMLGERFAARVVCGDAYALNETLGQVGEPVAAVVSSLPLLNETPERRRRLLDEAFAMMGPEGVFVQFTYGLKSPIPREDLGGAYVARCGPPVLRNLPPASVWTYRRPGAQAGSERKVMKLIDQAEKFGQQFAARRRATEAMLNRHGERVKEIWKRETAGLIRPRPSGERDEP